MYATNTNIYNIHGIVLPSMFIYSMNFWFSKYWMSCEIWNGSGLCSTLIWTRCRYTSRQLLWWSSACCKSHKSKEIHLRAQGGIASILRSNGTPAKNKRTQKIIFNLFIFMKKLLLIISISSVILLVWYGVQSWIEYILRIHWSFELLVAPAIIIASVVAVLAYEEENK